MPLGFPSLSHGTIAFGFFNIETDLLLLEHYFFFADLFCSRVSRLAQIPGSDPVVEPWDVHTIEDRTRIGDLMGAIHGIRHTGFIGEIYRRFPFPTAEAGFKQKPDGFRNRSVVEGIMDGFTETSRIRFRAEPGKGEVTIGEYVFTVRAFQDLVQYVWLGGYPRWKDGIRPDYVVDMKRAIENSQAWLFAGLVLLP
jgi:hypothetical protein